MSLLVTCLSLILASQSARAEPDLDLTNNLAELEADPRLFFVNFTSSLVQVNSTILAYALLALTIVGAAAIALYYLYLESANAGTGYGQQYSQGYQSRSAGGDFDFNALNILKWINMAYEVYQKFEYNDLECQKKLICEVVKDQDETFGTVSSRMQKGFEFARYLEVLNLPDDFRELLDEYLDASERAQEGTKECEEFFQCPFSIKQTVKRNLSGNSL